MIKKKTVNKKPLSILQKRLAKAKKLYPVGTKFTSRYGSDDVVTYKGDRTHYIDYGIKCICVQGENEERIIYDGYWAKIHK